MSPGIIADLDVAAPLARSQAARSLTCVRADLDAGLGTVAAAATTLTSAITLLATLKRGIAAADRSAIVSVQDGVRALRGASRFGIVDLLSLDASEPLHRQTVSLVAALARSPSGAMTVRSIQIDRRATALFGQAADVDAPSGVLDAIDRVSGRGIVDMDAAAASVATIAGWGEQVAAAARRAAEIASQLSIVRSRITLQARFIGALAKAEGGDPSPLVNPDLDAASTRETALRTRRMLSGQPLSIANMNRQLVLKLFQES